MTDPLPPWWPERYDPHQPGQLRPSATRTRSAEQAAWRAVTTPPPAGRTAHRQALAILTPLAQAGHTAPDAIRFALMTGPGTIQLRQRHRHNPARTRRWLGNLYQHSWETTVAQRDPTLPQAARFHQRLTTVWWQTALTPAPGQRGPITRSILLTLLATAHTNGQLQVAIPAPMISLWSGVSVDSVRRVLGAGRQPWWPEPWPTVVLRQAGTLMRPNRYTVRPPARRSDAAQVPDSVFQSLSCRENDLGESQPESCTSGLPGPAGSVAGLLMGSVGHDCWLSVKHSEAGSVVGPGHVGHLLLCLLLAWPDRTRAELANRAGRGVGSVSPVVTVLAEAGLVTSSGRRWRLAVGGPAGLRAGMDRLAVLTGTAGFGERYAGRVASDQEAHRQKIGSLAREHADRRAADHALGLLADLPMPWTVTGDARRAAAEQLPARILTASATGIEATVRRRSVRAGDPDRDDLNWVARHVTRRLGWPTGWEETRDWCLAEVTR